MLFDLDLGVQARMAERASARAQAAKDEARRLKAPLDAGLQARLAGNYRSDALGDIQIVAGEGATWLDTGGWRSELAAPTEASTATVVETISPGGAGLVLEAGERSGQRTLRVSDGEREYEFVESSR